MISYPTDPALRDQIVATREQPFGSFLEILTGWARAQPDAIALVDEQRDVAWAGAALPSPSRQAPTDPGGSLRDSG